MMQCEDFTNSGSRELKFLEGCLLVGSVVGVHGHGRPSITFLASRLLGSQSGMPSVFFQLSISSGGLGESYNEHQWISSSAISRD
jgi:hypothetical protein